MTSNMRTISRDEIVAKYPKRGAGPSLDDLCDELGIGQRVPGPMGSVGGKARSPAVVELLAQLAKPAMSFPHDGRLTAVFHNNKELRFAKVQPLDWNETTGTVSEIPPPSGAELLAMMQKMTAELNKHPPGELAERIDMGKDALAELRRQTLTAPTALPNALPTLFGIRVVFNEKMDDDQWIVYDRHGIPLAFGRTSEIKRLVMREST